MAETHRWRGRGRVPSGGRCGRGRTPSGRFGGFGGGTPLEGKVEGGPLLEVLEGGTPLEGKVEGEPLLKGLEGGTPLEGKVHSKFASVKNALSKYYNSFGVLPTIVRVKLNKKTSSIGENNRS